MNNNNHDLFVKIDEIERTLLINKGQRDAMVATINEKKENLKENEQLVVDFEEAIKFLTSTAKKARDTTIKGIENLATLAVQSVYDEPIKIRLQYGEKSKSDSSDKLVLQVVRDTPKGEVVTGLMDEVGGGLIETVSFALRIACIKWLGYKGPIILDEAYKSLSSDEKIERIATFLQELNESVGNQIIFSTHKQDVFGPIASKVFIVSQKNLISEVTDAQA